MFRGSTRGGGAVKYEDFEDVAQKDQWGKKPIQNDAAFMHGVVCKAKFIGSLEVPKPQSRPEIISAMRRIRYEYKARNVLKVKVRIRISVTGVTVTKRPKKKRKKSTLTVMEEPEVLLESPVYRIFFVAHDSVDRQIFSLLVRAEVENRKCFICAVFKAYKKSHALRIVRTVGQVFDAALRMRDTPEAAKIPGLLPPERIKAMKDAEEAKKAGDDVGAQKALDAMKEDDEATQGMKASGEANAYKPPAPAPPVDAEPLIQFDDNYEMQVKTFEQQQGDAQYNAQQAARLDVVQQTQQTESADLMREFGLSVEQQQFLMTNYQVPGSQPKPGAGAPAAAGGSGLPSMPPNNRGNLPQGQKAQLGKSNSGMFDTTDGPQSIISATDRLDTESPVDVYGDTNATSPEEAKRLLPRLFAMQRAQSAQLQLLQDQLSSETRRRVVSEAKVEHLLQQNKELADHVTWLVQQVKTHSGAAPDLPPTKRQLPSEETSAGASGLASGSPDFGFDDSFVPQATTAVTITNGQKTVVSMPSKKVTSSEDSDSDSDNDDVQDSSSVATRGTTVSATPYGRLGDTDEELDAQTKAKEAPAAPSPIFAHDPQADTTANLDKVKFDLN